MDFILFSRILLRRKWLILVTSLACAIITFGLSKLASKSYKSQAQLATGITDNFEVSLNDSKDNRDELRNMYSNFLEFLKSKDLLTLVSYRMVLHEFEAPKPFRPKQLEEARKKFNKKQWNQLHARFKHKYENFEGVSGLVKEDIVLKDFTKNLDYDFATLEKELSVNRVVETDFVEAKVTTENPYLSSFLVNAFCEEAIRFNNHQQSNRSEHSLDFFSDIVRQKKEIYDKKMDSVKAFKDVVDVVNHEAETQKKLDQIADLETLRNEDAKKINSLTQVIKLIENQLLQQDVNSNGNVYLNNKIYTLKDRINILLERQNASGVKDKATEDSVKILRKQLTSLVKNLDDEGQDSKILEELKSKRINAEIELEQAKSNLITIERNLGTMRLQLNGFSMSKNELANLDMSAEVSKQEYLQVLEKFNAAKNAALKSRIMLRQIETGEPADQPEASKTIILTILSFVFSISFFIVFVFVREYLDKTIKTPESFRKQLPFRLIGIINSIPGDKNQIAKIFASKSESKEHEKFKELLRKIRVEIENLKSSSIMVTSLKVGEGKSFVIFSLAYSLSLIGKKILILDTNFKNNTLTRLLSATPELEDMTLDNVSSNDLFLSVVNNGTAELVVSEASSTSEFDIAHKTAYKNVFVIGCKGSELSPTELFQGKHFDELMVELKSRFDYIFMEGPSLNEFSDTKELVGFVDKVITVFAANNSISQHDQLSIEYLESLNEKHVGSILNLVDIKNLYE